MLKIAQHEVTLGAAIDDNGLTSDPLRTKNAHVNSTCLRVTMRRYCPDCYGPFGKKRLRGLPSNRLVAGRPLASPRANGEPAGKDPGFVSRTPSTKIVASPYFSAAVVARKPARAREGQSSIFARLQDRLSRQVAAGGFEKTEA